MLLHCDMRVEVVQGPVRLSAVGPGALVQALNLVVPTTWTLLDSVTGERNEGVILAVQVIGRWMSRKAVSALR